MRVANRTAYDTVKYNLARASTELSKASLAVSSGKRITRLSDDPAGW